jgi:hypothetical protein
MADSTVSPPLPNAAIDFNSLHDAAKAGKLNAETLEQHIIPAAPAVEAPATDPAPLVEPVKTDKPTAA